MRLAEFQSTLSAAGSAPLQDVIKPPAKPVVITGDAYRTRISNLAAAGGALAPCPIDVNVRVTP